jgi:hypothetical protein
LTSVLTIQLYTKCARLVSSRQFSDTVQVSQPAAMQTLSASSSRTWAPRFTIRHAAAAKRTLTRGGCRGYGGRGAVWVSSRCLAISTCKGQPCRPALILPTSHGMQNRANGLCCAHRRAAPHRRPRSRSWTRSGGWRRSRRRPKRARAPKRIRQRRCGARGPRAPPRAAAAAWRSGRRASCSLRWAACRSRMPAHSGGAPRPGSTPRRHSLPPRAPSPLACGRAGRRWTRWRRPPSSTWASAASCSGPPRWGPHARRAGRRACQMQGRVQLVA